jgi:hypothetical protein
VPWRFSDAGRWSAWIIPPSRHPKTCTETVIRFPRRHRARRFIRALL